MCECNGTFREEVSPGDPDVGVAEETIRVYEPRIPLAEHPIAPAVVLDPFMGSGTTALVSVKARRSFLGIELHPDYAEMAAKRVEPEFAQGRLL